MPDEQLPMKDGSVVHDPRLGRLPEFDERSREYPVRKLLKAEGIKKPRSYTWACDTHLDQGNMGSCVGHYVAHELAARPMVVPVDSAWALGFYQLAQQLDQWPGGEYPGASPRYSGSSMLGGAKAMQKRGYITEYRWGFSIDDLILTVGYFGPVGLGINWKEAMFYPDEKGVIRNDGKVMGGHAILCRGVNVKTKLARLHNSWGTSWSQGGDCFISFDDLEGLLKEQGECVIPIGRAHPKS